MKILKKLITCALLAFSIFAFIGCDNTKKETEQEKLLRLYDTNNNKVVDYWEEPFSTTTANHTVPISTDANPVLIKEINSIADLLAINENEERGNTIFSLKNDLDFKDYKESTIEPIDFSGASFYGNGKTISNFKISHIIGESTINYDYVLFKNLSKLFDLNVMFGEVDNQEYGTMNDFSLLKNTQETINKCVIDNVKVKGFYKISINKVGDGDTDIKLGFLYSDNFSVDEKTKTITNCEVVGGIDIKKSEAFNGDSQDADIKVTVGGIAPNASRFMTIKNCKCTLNCTGELFSENTMGGVVGNNNGFIENCVVDFKSNLIASNLKETICGGIVGALNFYGEIKNCIADIDITADNENTGTIAYGCLVAGGICGRSEGSIFYNEVNGNILIKGLREICLGGLVGASSNSYISKNIARTEIDVLKANNIFVAGFVGNAVGGMIRSSVSMGKLNIVVDENSYSNTNLGLLFFNSNYYLGKDDTKLKTTLNNNSSKTSDGEGEGNREQASSEFIKPFQSPDLLYNIINEKWTIEKKYTESETTTDTYSEINYGGYWWWLFNSSLISTTSPDVFSNSNCFEYSIIIINKNKESIDKTTATGFKPVQNSSWLFSQRLTSMIKLNEYGLNTTELNLREAQNFDELKFYNNTSQQGSYYTSIDQTVDNYLDGKFDRYITTVSELQYLIKYSCKLKEMTFIAEDNLSLDENTQANTIIYTTTSRENESMRYYTFSSNSWENVEDEAYVETTSEDFFGEEKLNYKGSKILKTILNVLLFEKCTTEEKMELVFDKNNNCLNIYYNEDGGKFDSHLGLKAYQVGGTYRCTLIQQ